MRFLKLYRTFLVQRLKAMMEYRIDFLTGAASFLINQITNVVFISIIFSQIPSLDGYLYEEILFIYGFSLIPKGLDHLLTDNLWKVAWFIVRKGDFDKYLTRPIHPLVHVIMEDFQPDAFGELLIGIVLMGSAASALMLEWTVVKVLLMLIAVIFGALIFTGIKIIGAAIALWIKQSGSILQIFYLTSDFAKYPVTIYSSFVRNIVTYIIPFAFTAYYPAAYLLRGENPVMGIGGVVVAGSVLLTVGILVWNRGLRAYESAGS